MSEEDLRAEIARLRAGEADTPPPKGAAPTPAQWIRSWNDLSAEQRLKCAEHIMNGAEQAYRCFTMDHEGRIEELEAASRRQVDACIKPAPKSKPMAVTGEPRLFANEIQAILNDLGLTHTVAKINATARPEPGSHNAMIFLTDQATEDTTKQLMDAFAARGWMPSDHPNNTKIHVHVPKAHAPSGETP